jgi:hypothetical protein
MSRYSCGTEALESHRHHTGTMVVEEDRCAVLWILSRTYLASETETSRYNLVCTKPKIEVWMSKGIISTWKVSGLGYLL